LVRDGDPITIDARAHTVDMDISEAEMERRRAGWSMPPYKAARGTLHKYIKTVKSASEGCVTDE
jgi:dihydroxy-acid dehydratase